MEPLPLSLQHRQGGAGGSGLKPHSQEHHLLFWMGFGQLQSIHGGVYHLDVCPQGLLPPQIKPGLGAGHPHQIPVGGEGDPGQSGYAQHLVHHIGGGDAHRTAGPGDQLHLGGQQLPHPGAGQGHGVGAAHLHEAHGGQALVLDGRHQPL